MSWLAAHRIAHLSLQADGKVAFEDIPVFGICRPACHDSLLYLFVLVLFLEAVVLSQASTRRSMGVGCQIFRGENVMKV